ncbi:MAG: hypothetical protein HEQ32_04405 [Vampirovibrio sp.]|jgi:F0F1-type ATP synthase epsilon subunit
MPLVLKVMAPDAIQVDEVVRSVSLPSTEGDLGILEKRQKVLVRLKKGLLRYEGLNGESRSMPIGGGLAYNDGETVTVLLRE